MRTPVASLSKKLISTFFATVLAFGLMPTTALAENSAPARADNIDTTSDEPATNASQDESTEAGFILSNGEEGIEDNAMTGDTSNPDISSDGIINQEVALDTVVAQAESTKSFFLAQTLESTHTVPVVSAQLPMDTSQGNGSSEDEENKPVGAVSVASTVVGSFEYLGMTFAIEAGGESVALVAADYAKLPEEFIEKQVIVIPAMVTPGSIDSYSVTRIADDAFADFTEENANPDYTGCEALFADEELLEEAGVDPVDLDEDDPLAGCTGILALGIPASVTTIEDEAFSGFDTLQYIVVSEDNQNYASYDGALYSANLTNLRLIPEGRVGTIRVAPSATTVDPEVFSHCPSVDTVVADPEDVNPDMPSLAGYFDAFMGSLMSQSVLFCATCSEGAESSKNLYSYAAVQYTYPILTKPSSGASLINLVNGGSSKALYLHWGRANWKTTAAEDFPDPAMTGRSCTEKLTVRQTAYPYVFFDGNVNLDPRLGFDSAKGGLWGTYRSSEANAIANKAKDRPWFNYNLAVSFTSGGAAYPVTGLEDKNGNRVANGATLTAGETYYIVEVGGVDIKRGKGLDTEYSTLPKSTESSAYFINIVNKCSQGDLYLHWGRLNWRTAATKDFPDPTMTGRFCVEKLVVGQTAYPYVFSGGINMDPRWGFDSARGGFWGQYRSGQDPNKSSETDNIWFNYNLAVSFTLGGEAYPVTGLEDKNGNKIANGASLTAGETYYITEVGGHTVSWEGNGGTFSIGSGAASGRPSQANVMKGSAPIWPTQASAPSGYEFKGWNTAGDYTGECYVSAEELPAMGTSDVTYYAQWEYGGPNGMTFAHQDGAATTFVRTGTKVLGKSTVRVDSAVDRPDDDDGWSFAGWAFSEDGAPIDGMTGEIGASSEIAPASAYYGRWSATVSYITAGGSIPDGDGTWQAATVWRSSADPSVYVAHELPGGPAPIDGIAKHFSGWRVTSGNDHVEGVPSATRVFAAGERLNVKGPIVLTAQYDDNVLTVNWFDDDATTLLRSKEGVVYGTTFGALASDTAIAQGMLAPKPEHELLGWSTDPNGAAALEADAKLTAEVTNLYPVYRKLYAVALDLAGGEGDGWPEAFENLTYDAPTMELPADKPKRAGYVFSGLKAYAGEEEGASAVDVIDAGTNLSVDTLQPGHTYKVLNLVGGSGIYDVKVLRAVWIPRIAVDVTPSIDMGILADFGTNTLKFQCGGTDYVAGDTDNAYAPLEFVSYTTAPVGIVAVTDDTQDAGYATRKAFAEKVFGGAENKSKVSFRISADPVGVNFHTFSLGGSTEPSASGFLDGLTIQKPTGAASSRTTTFYLGMDFGNLAATDLLTKESGQIAKLYYTVAILKDGSPESAPSVLAPYDGNGILW